MDMVSRLFLYILIANVGYMIFSLAIKGFRAFAGYIAQLGLLLGFMIFCLLKLESGFWSVIASLAGVFILVGVPLLLQKQIERLISEQRFSEIEPLARWKANIAWSEMNGHLLAITQIAARQSGPENSAKECPEVLRGLLGRGEPYDGMTRVFLGMLLFHSRKFEQLLEDLLIPGRPFDEYPFEELLYIVRGFLETGNYDESVRAQMALERQVAAGGSEEYYANLMVCRLIFFAFMGWEEDFFGLIGSGDKVLTDLPEPLKKYWGGFACFNAGQFTKGEALMEEGLTAGSEELPEHWIRWMESRLAGIRENKEFFHSAIIPRLAEIRGRNHPEYHHLVNATTVAAKPVELADRATSWLMGLNCLVFLLMLYAGAMEDMVDLVGLGANCGFLVMKGEWFRLFTYQFLHLGWTHLLMNVIALRYFGPPIETLLGPKMFVGAYLFCGLCGGLATVYSHAGLSVGASASIAGLLGIALIFEVLGDRRQRVFPAQGYLPTLIFIVIINFLIGILEKGIDNSAHVGGFAGGLAIGLAAVFVVRRPFTRILGSLVGAVFVCLIFGLSSYKYQEARALGGYPIRFAGLGEAVPASWPIQLRIPEGWTGVGSPGSDRVNAIQGPLSERIDFVLAANQDPEKEVLDQYLEERTKAMSQTSEVEFQTRFGPKERQIGGKTYYEVRWRLAIDSRRLTERDLLLFDSGRLLLIQCILPTHHDEVYDKPLLEMLETLKLK